MRSQAASDSATVEGLVGSWILQLPAKRPDGKTYDDAAILAEHQGLRTSHTDAGLP